MTRVRIRTDNSKNPRRKQNLLEILSSCEIYVVRIIPATDTFIIITNTKNDLDKIFDGSTNAESKKVGHDL